MDGLREVALEMGVVLDEGQLLQFELYKNLLLEWNKKLNLTRITDENDIVLKHFADSIALVPYLVPCMAQVGKSLGEAAFRRPHPGAPPKGGAQASLIDIGTGAGFPGVPLKITLPDLNVTLLDSLNKRLVFVNAVIKELGIKNIRTVHARAEDGAHNKDLREAFDWATARAVSRLSVLAEYCLPYVKAGGVFAAYKGALAHGEINEAKPAIKILGGEIENVIDIKLADFRHTIIMTRKIRQTPPKYPRTPAKITQFPIK